MDSIEQFSTLDVNVQATKFLERYLFEFQETFEDVLDLAEAFKKRSDASLRISEDDFCAMGQCHSLTQARNAVGNTVSSEERGSFFELCLAVYNKTVSDYFNPSASSMSPEDEARLKKAIEDYQRVQEEIAARDNHIADLEALVLKGGVKGLRAKAEVDALKSQDSTDRNRRQVRGAAAQRSAQKDVLRNSVGGAGNTAQAQLIKDKIASAIAERMAKLQHEEEERRAAMAEQFAGAFDDVQEEEEEPEAQEEEEEEEEEAVIVDVEANKAAEEAEAAELAEAARLQDEREAAKRAKDEEERQKELKEQQERLAREEAAAREEEVERERLRVEKAAAVEEAKRKEAERQAQLEAEQEAEEKKRREEQEAEAARIASLEAEEPAAAQAAAAAAEAERLAQKEAERIAREAADKEEADRIAKLEAEAAAAEAEAERVRELLPVKNFRAWNTADAAALAQLEEKSRQFCFSPLDWNDAFRYAASSDRQDVVQSLRRVVLNETLAAIERGKYELATEEDVPIELDLNLDLIQAAIAGAQLYPALHPWLKSTESIKGTAHFLQGDCLDVAAWLINSRKVNPAVVVSVDPTGTLGPCERGSCSQEEEIWRRTTFSAVASATQFLPIEGSGCRYVPHVQLLRQGEAAGYAFSTAPLELAFIAAVAIQNPQQQGMLNRYSDADNLRIRTTIRAMFGSALQHGHDAIVIPAFGCGFAGGNPAIIASMFHDVLVTEYPKSFKHVTFAITDDVNGPANFENFQAAYVNRAQALAKAKKARADKKVAKK